MNGNVEKYPDRIADLLHGRVLFMSGGSGFIGKTLIEKILRCCGGVKTIYILIRNKKGKSPEERVQDIFNSAVFNVLRESQPEQFKKCKAIAGDVSLPDLGISKEDRNLLRTEVDLIYHSAASTRFDDTMKKAVVMNTLGTKYMLELANECKKLKAFIHVSTAYSQPKEDVLYEKSYPPPANPYDVISSLNWIDEEGNPELTKTLLGDIPNTYTYSKALAEALVEEQMEKLPVIICRPSVVVPIWKDPVPGWCNNLQGPTGLFVGAGKGIIRSMYVNSEAHADFVPADIVANGLLVATWDFITNKKRRYYNITSSEQYALSWSEIVELGKEVIYTRLPFNGIVWYPGGTMKKSRLHHNICFYLFQLVPALFIDLLLFILGYKPVLYQIQRRIEKGGEMFEFYTWKEWNLDHTELMKAKAELNPRERKTYILDGDGMNLLDYFTDCVHASRLYILKETDDMIPAARRNMKIMWCVDKISKALIVFAFFYYMFKWLVSPILGRYFESLEAL